MRRDLISKKKRKNMKNCGIIVDWQMTRQKKKIATCLCSIAHLPAHTTKCITFATQSFICGRSELKPSTGNVQQVDMYRVKSASLL